PGEHRESQTGTEKAGRLSRAEPEILRPGRHVYQHQSAAFKDQLETTISDMMHDAEKAGVGLPNAPAKYDFTFKPQRSSMDFPPDTLVPLAMQVAEIKAICDILFAARVQTMVGLRRTPVAKEDEGATDYLFGRKPTTNTVASAVLVPYEIVFQGFTAE